MGAGHKLLPFEISYIIIPTVVVLGYKAEKSKISNFKYQSALSSARNELTLFCPREQALLPLSKQRCFPPLTVLSRASK